MAHKKPGGAQWWIVAAFIGPAMLAILIVNVYPILYNFYMSLTNRNGPRRFPEGMYEVVGFDNYIRLLTQSEFYAVFGKTVLYAVICVFFFFVVGLSLALVLNHPAIKGKYFWRTLLILPWAVPTWITAMIWRFLFHGQFGPINQILRSLGLPAPNWLSDSFWAFVAITIVNIWMTFPFFMLILLGGLQAIPTDIYEAAEMDGASFWQGLFAITLPLLRPVALPAIILSLITTFQMFNTVWLMTRGGPRTLPGQPGATELLLIWAYNQGFAGQGQRFALVSAFAIVVFFFLLGLTLLYNRVTNVTKGAYE
ncbi:MAG: sugar ABC transporter permease [Candidatus Viridilinea halotolerans]|uniref:Sugar ABC transporter permease n=1 Tax=Candidatus Viridilinea halotolerans TaxID=2491704 RepID=A0A426UA32_9CHLR|nr:MAG: sugar ABC transporter permease [Candidatus Viridilinea halotolerans]